VEYCIREGLQRFEPGTQGEHKISRGFVPVATFSAHWLANPEFDQAVGDFVQREGAHTDAYIREMTTHSPYRQQTPSAT